MRSSILSLIAILSVSFFLASPSQASETAASDARIRAYLAAGEFAPALQRVRQLAPAERDAWLGRIAVAQACAGAEEAALRSVGEIGDDRARSETLGRIRELPANAQGGGTQADFDPLIDLITKTIKPTSWDDVGGPASIMPFPAGVWIDSQGLLKPLMKSETGGNLAALRAANSSASANQSIRQSSQLRKISLTRLEKQIQLLTAAGRPIPEEMQLLAGLERIQYVFVYPESGDIVLAGPAGDWIRGLEGNVVSRESGRPVLKLDDLVVVWRLMLSQQNAAFGCLITPRQEGLAKLNAYIQKTAPRFASNSDRRHWAEELRAQIGRQDIEVYGLDPRTRAARVMVEADYRMKLVGMGLEEGMPGVKSYLNSIEIPPSGSPPPMGVLRWWFTLNYEAVIASQDRQAFSIQGQGLQVESENERLTDEGKRVHTGQSEDLNRAFAQSFTVHFAELAEKYPIYAELRNLGDLALAGTLLREESLPDKTGWHLTLFGDPGAFPVMQGEAPKEVDSVVNFRVIKDSAAKRRLHSVAGVSGGVAFKPASYVQGDAIRVENDYVLAKGRLKAKPSQLPADRWWWD
jgi:hypothetical protein